MENVPCKIFHSVGHYYLKNNMVRKIGFQVSWIKMISLGLKVSADPKADKRSFLYEGKLWRNLKSDIAQGVCAKYSKM
jgi:hypothetical protein